MASRKKTQKVETAFIVIPVDATLAYNSLEFAKSSAKDECEISGSDFYIFEVVKSWHVQIPDEPEAEIADSDLENLL